MAPLTRLILISALAFTWFAVVGLRQVGHKTEEVQRLKGAAQLLLTASLDSASQAEAHLHRVADALSFDRLEIVQSDGKPFAQGGKTRPLHVFDRLLNFVGLLSAASISQSLPQGVLPGLGVAELRATYLDRSIYGHGAWLAFLATLGGLIHSMAALSLRRRKRSQGLLARERATREQAEAELSHLHAFERLLYRLTSRLQETETHQLESAFRETLEDCGKFLNVDRMLMARLGPKSTRVRSWLDWPHLEMSENAVQILGPADLEAQPWLLAALHARRLIVINQLDELPLEAKSLADSLSAMGLMQVLLAPLSQSSGPKGYILIGRRHFKGPWSPEDQSLVRLCAQMLSDADARTQKQGALSGALEREQLAAQLGARFLSVAHDDMDKALNGALQDLGNFAKVERACLWALHGDGELLSQSHEWVTAGTPSMVSSSQNIKARGLPNMLSRWGASQPWTVTDIETLPVACEPERLEARRRGVSAFISVPITYRNAPLGGLWLETRIAGRVWDAGVVQACLVAAELAANALARQRAETAQRRSEVRYRSLLEAVPDLMLRFNHQGHILDVRFPRGQEPRHLAPLLGQPLASLEGKLPPFDPVGLTDKILEKAGQTRPQSFDWLTNGPRGQRWFEARVVPGETEHLVILRDIHEEKRQELDHEKLLANLLAIFNAGSQSIVLVDSKGRIEAFNHNAAVSARLLRRRDIHAGLPVIELLPTDEGEAFHKAFTKAMQGEELRRDRYVTDAEGERSWYRVEYLPIFSEQGDVRAVCFAFDSINDLKQAELALTESETRYAIAARGANDGLWDWDIKKSRWFFSERWAAQLGLSPEAGPSDFEAWLALIHPEDRDNFINRWQAHIKGQTHHFECEYRALNQSSSDYVWMLARGMAIFSEPGMALRFAGSQTDIDNRKRGEQRQELAALSDPLTGLPNRVLLLDRMGRSLARMSRNKRYGFCVLMLDTNHFKLINDSLGHEKGDELLVAMARRLEELLRPGDTVARLGGDEFVILLEDMRGHRDVMVIAERVHAQIKPVFNVRGREIFATVSIGLALSEGHEGDAEELLRDAETALVQSKALGPSQQVIFDPAMHAQAVSRLELETDLRRAIEAKNFSLHYQPLMRMRDGSLYGFEALLRWQHPERGMIPPVEFIPLAEETRQIVALGRLVLEMALNQWQQWQALGLTQGLTLNVNLSGEEIKRETLANEIQGMVESRGLLAQQLQFEITESVLMDNPAAAATSFQKLRGHGFRLAIDDFGTGYSSLSYLHRFEVDTLKIDRSFVSRIDGLSQNEAVIVAVVAMAQNLGLGVVAEGVENEVQRDRLLAMGCELAQGFFFARPMTAEAAGAYLNKPPQA